jgi:hypothetical protein
MSYEMRVYVNSKFPRKFGWYEVLLLQDLKINHKICENTYTKLDIFLLLYINIFVFI